MLVLIAFFRHETDLFDGLLRFFDTKWTQNSKQTSPERAVHISTAPIENNG